MSRAALAACAASADRAAVPAAALSASLRRRQRRGQAFLDERVSSGIDAANSVRTVFLASSMACWTSTTITSGGVGGGRSAGPWSAPGPGRARADIPQETEDGNHRGRPGRPRVVAADRVRWVGTRRLAAQVASSGGIPLAPPARRFRRAWVRRGRAPPAPARSARGLRLRDEHPIHAPTDIRCDPLHPPPDIDRALRGSRRAALSKV